MTLATNALLLLAFGLVGCSGCGDNSTPSSGPADAGGLDAASDALPDAADDVRADATDAADADTGAGGGLGDASVVDEGEWVRSPFADFAGCTIEQPKDLSAVTRADWLPCAGSDNPCRMLDTSYLANTGVDTRLAFLASVQEGPPFLLGTIRRMANSILSPTIYADSGEPAAAWRLATDQHCGFYLFRASRGRVGLILTPTEAARQVSGVSQRVLVGTPAELLAGQGEHYDLLFNVTNMNGVENLSFSDTLLVADGQPGGRLYVAKRPNGAFEEVPKQGGKLWDKHVLVGNELIAAAADDLADLYIRHPDGTVALLKGDPTRAEGLAGADETFIAWQEGSGGTLWSSFQHMEVWAAPFTTDPASLQPHKVADLPNSAFYDFAFGEGWYIVRLETGGARFVHLADSKYVDIAPPPSLEFTRAVAVTGGEAWFLMRTSPGPKDPVTIARYDLASIASKLP